jgi:hypothetical protein
MIQSFGFHEIAAGFPDDELLRLELRVAQRADQLAARFGGGPERDRACWQQAEREEWGLALEGAS